MIYFCILGWILIFCVWLSYEIKKNNRQISDAEFDFWEKESAANNVRKVSRDTLPYVTFPIETFPIGIHSDSTLEECESALKELHEKDILNLTGKTATDIKELYGLANLSFADQCDMNYTELIQVLAAYGARLHELGFDDEAITVLESGIDILTDISSNYKLLAQLYQKRNQSQKISHLRDVAKNLNSLNKNKILKILDEYERVVR